MTHSAVADPYIGRDFYTLTYLAGMTVIARMVSRTLHLSDLIPVPLLLPVFSGLTGLDGYPGFPYFIDIGFKPVVLPLRSARAG
jgi:hypothetical protein